MLQIIRDHLCFAIEQRMAQIWAIVYCHCFLPLRVNSTAKMLEIALYRIKLIYKQLFQWILRITMNCAKNSINPLNGKSTKLSTISNKILRMNSFTLISSTKKNLSPNVNQTIALIEYLHHYYVQHQCIGDHQFANTKWKKQRPCRTTERK